MNSYSNNEQGNEPIRLCKSTDHKKQYSPKLTKCDIIWSLHLEYIGFLIHLQIDKFATQELKSVLIAISF